MVYELTVGRSTPSEIHARPLPDPLRPEVWHFDISRPALVLGSATDESIVDLDACAAVGAEVVRRRSGGGAVWVAPGDVVWVDVIVPAGSRGWTDDISRSMVWFGEHLRDAFAAAGMPLSVHDGPMSTTRWSDAVCFDGVGPGELVRGDAKVVGVSQRRVRAGARFQSCWYVRYDPSELTDLLRPSVDPSVLRPVATVDRHVADVVPAELAAALRASAGRT